MMNENVTIAAVLLQLGATDAEVDAADKIMGPWAIASTPAGVVADCRKALAQVRQSVRIRQTDDGLHVDVKVRPKSETIPITIEPPTGPDLPGPIELLRERDEAIERVLKLHAPTTYPDLPYPICEHCTGDGPYQWWPCPTVQAIRGE